MHGSLYGIAGIATSTLATLSVHIPLGYSLSSTDQHECMVSARKGGDFIRQCHKNYQSRGDVRGGLPLIGGTSAAVGHVELLSWFNTGEVHKKS